MGVVATLTGLLALALGGYRLARNAFGLPRGLPATLGAFLLAWAWMSLATLGLGLAGWLARGPLLVATIAGPVVAYLATRSSPKAPAADDPGPTGSWSVSVALALGLTLWAVLSLAVPSLLLPVKVVSDGPIYHLYFAARWWKAGRIFLVPTPFGETAAPYFPALGDLWLTWLIALWGGDRTARLAQVPFLAIATLAVFDLARRSGARPAAAVVAACWFATVTPLLIFTNEPIVDTIFVAGYVLAFVLAARFLFGEGGAGSLVLAGLAAGAAWGTKAPGIVFVPPLVAVVAVAVLARPGPWRARIRNTAIVLVTPLILGGFWPARNAWLTGNPLYPIEVSAFGRTILPGWFPREAMRTSKYYLPANDWRAGLDILLSVLDPRLLPIWLAAVAGAWRIGSRPGRGDRLAWACAGFAVLNLALFWLFVPYRTQQRFALHATALAAVPLARLFDRGRAVLAAGVALLAVHVLTPQEWPFATALGRIPWDFSPFIPWQMPSPVAFLGQVEALARPSRGHGSISAILWLAVGAVSLAAGGLMVWARCGGRWRWVAPAAAAVVAAGVQSFVVEAGVTEPILFRFPYFRDYLLGWSELDSRIGQAPARIAYAGTNLPYYLMGHDSGLAGHDFRNEVRYVNPDGRRGWLLHDYHREATRLEMPPAWPDTRPGWDRLRPDYGAWLASLDAEGIQLLVVAQADPVEGRFNVFDDEGFPVERAFADAHPERFRPIYADPKFRLYGVRPPQKIGGVPTDSPARSH